VCEQVCIAGNHELCFDDEMYAKSWSHFHRCPARKPGESSLKDLLSNATVLNDECITLCGLQIYGRPDVMMWRFGTPMAFNRSPSQMESIWSRIPSDCDVLITHGPPYGVFDRFAGSLLLPSFLPAWRDGDPALAAAVRHKKPRVHVFGHGEAGRVGWRIGSRVVCSADVCFYVYAVHEEFGHTEEDGVHYVACSMLGFTYGIPSARHPIVMDVVPRTLD
jgi:hypothetical protein